MDSINKVLMKRMNKDLTVQDAIRILQGCGIMDQNKEIVEAYKPLITKRGENNTMNDNKYPELWDDKDIEEYVKDIHSNCIDNDCKRCLRYNELGKEACMPKIIFELWRKWHNKILK